MDNEDKDLLGNCVSNRVSSQLNLEYYSIIEGDKAIRIIIATVCLAFAIYKLPTADSVMHMLSGVVALCIYIRMTMGSPLVRRLTPDSMARVQLWMATEEKEISESSKEASDSYEHPKDA